MSTNNEIPELGVPTAQFADSVKLTPKAGDIQQKVNLFIKKNLSMIESLQQENKKKGVEKTLTPQKYSDLPVPIILDSSGKIRIEYQDQEPEVYEEEEIDDIDFFPESGSSESEIVSSDLDEGYPEESDYDTAGHDFDSYVSFEEQMSKAGDFLRTNKELISGIKSMDTGAEPTAIKFSRKDHDDLPFSITLTPEGKIFINTRNLVGQGGFKSVKELVPLELDSEAVVLKPKKQEGSENLEPIKIQFQKEGDIYLKFSGQEGFLKCHAVKVMKIKEPTSQTIEHSEKVGIITDKYKRTLSDQICLDAFGDEEHLKQTKKVRILQLVNALNTMHKAGVYHLDLKQDNILIDESGEKLAIIDFGCSLDKSKGMQGPFLPGKENIRPPEMVLRTESIAKIRSADPSLSDLDIHVKLAHAQDVWSLGLILYHIYYGKPLIPNALQKVPNEKQESYNKRIAVSCKKLLENPAGLHEFLGVDPSEVQVPEGGETTSPKSIPELIGRLLTLDYESRPTMDQVRQWIEET